jgi:hypothetical protein
MDFSTGVDDIQRGFCSPSQELVYERPSFAFIRDGRRIAILDDGRGERAALTVINRGTEPTMPTHMVVFTYPSRWRRFKDKPDHGRSCQLSKHTVQAGNKSHLDGDDGLQ